MKLIIRPGEISKIVSGLYAAAGSFIMVAGWNWYHFPHRPHWKFELVSIIAWLAVLASFGLFKWLYFYLVKKYNKHLFWQADFFNLIDRLWLVGSFLFILFFSKNEIFTLAYVAIIFAILFALTQRFLKRHPEPKNLLVINSAIFILAYFIFLVVAIGQYAAFKYYILDSNVMFYNIVFFRSWCLTMFWLLGFMLASYIYARVKNIFRYLFLIIWILAFGVYLVFWVINVGMLYYSGLYLNPTVLEHINGAGSVAKNNLTVFLVTMATIIFVLFVLVVKKFIKAHVPSNIKYWRYYNAVIAVAAVLFMVGFTSFKNTPEAVVITSFYNYFKGDVKEVKLSQIVQKKLEMFGLFYKPSEFYVAQRPNVFSTSTTALPYIAKTQTNIQKLKPNVVIIFLESFSARLTDVYNSHFTDLTPGLDNFAADPNTTIFYKYFNASTPTITGTLSQLCSFLPPTGHNEIENEKKLQNHHLLCLPEALKKYAGFKYANYITAVEKEYANKDSLFRSMGVDMVYGTEELSKYISGKPLSWGYSDHQMFPALFNFMKDAVANKQTPFLMSLATVDTHPPFNLAKDAVNYGDGKQPVLNMFHTTDDAFGKFWEQFKNSEFYNNTILITVADHAIFPGAYNTGGISEWPGQTDVKSFKTFYDQNALMVYIPNSVLPKKVDVYASGLSFTPSLLQLFNINIPNSFEGHSIFDDQKNYPELLGMHELGLYINQIDVTGPRRVSYNLPTEIKCDKNGQSLVSTTTPDLTLCDYLQFYHWKRQMFEQGRFWKH